MRGSLCIQGKHFSLVQPGDLLLVDHQGNVQPESGPNRLLNKAAFMIHSSVHAARPDANCAAHTHSVYGRAFSTLGKELDITTQDSCAFYKVSCRHSEHEQRMRIDVADNQSGCCFFRGRTMPCTSSTAASSWTKRRAHTS